MYMTLLRNIFFLYLASLSLPLWSQKQDLTKDYMPVTAQGIIPSDFTASLTQKTLMDREDPLGKDPKNVRKIKAEFKSMSHYFIDRSILSGMVLFGDPITDYVNSVADYLLHDLPELRKELRFYAVKNADVNAYATYQGIIFVHTGLIAKVQSEAQLAFVLAHEIVHYTQNHVLEDHVLKAQTVSTTLFRNLSLSEQQKKISSFSKESEYEADEKGFKTMLNTAYDVDHAKGIFDVLVFSYIPFDSIPFRPSFIETPYFQLPDTFYSDKSGPLTAIEDADDSKSSHPNIKNRRKNIEQVLANTASREGNTLIYPLGKARFETIQWYCRFESCASALGETAYGKALYDAYLLLQTFPDNAFGKVVFGKALFNIGYTALLRQRKKDHQKGDSSLSPQQRFLPSVPHVDDTEGGSYSLSYFLYHLEYEEIMCLGVRYLWNTCLNHGNAHGVEDFARTALSLLAKQTSLGRSYFLPLSQWASPPDSATFNQWVFSELLENPSFADAFDHAFAKENMSPRDAPSLSSFSNPQPSDIAVLEPFYIHLQRNKSTLSGLHPDLLMSDRERHHFIQVLHQMAESHHQNLSLLEPKRMTALDIEDYLDFTALKVWSKEARDLAEYPEIITQNHLLDPYKKKTACRYLMITGVISADLSPNRNLYALFYSIFNPHKKYLMFSGFDGEGVGGLASKAHLIHALFLDLDSGKPVYMEDFEYPIRLRKFALKQHIYHLFHQIQLLTP
jgi:hypothetical protein